jgi:hypothetical protein
MRKFLTCLQACLARNPEFNPRTTKKGDSKVDKAELPISTYFRELSSINNLLHTSKPLFFLYSFTLG